MRSIGNRIVQPDLLPIISKERHKLSISSYWRANAHKFCASQSLVNDCVENVPCKHQVSYQGVDGEVSKFSQGKQNLVAGLKLPVFVRLGWGHFEKSNFSFVFFRLDLELFEQKVTLLETLHGQRPSCKNFFKLRHTNLVVFYLLSKFNFVD